MTWVEWIPIISSQGLLIAEKLWQLWSAKGAPTQAEWDALKLLGKETAKTRMLLALAQGGIDPNSDQGKAFLALVA